MAVRTLYSARFDAPDLLIEQARNTTIVCKTYRAGAIATPTSGTITLFDAAGNVVVDEAAVTVSNGWATYTVLGTLTDDLEVETGWRAEWTLTMPDGEVHVFRTAEMVLCLCAPSPPVTV